jgi:hypothetical protein
MGVVHPLLRPPMFRRKNLSAFPTLSLAGFPPYGAAAGRQRAAFLAFWRNTGATIGRKLAENLGFQETGHRAMARKRPI